LAARPVCADQLAPRNHAEVDVNRLRVDVEVARRGYRRYAAYPAATAAGVFTNVVFGFLKGYMLLAVLGYQPVVGGYDEADVLTFTWLSQGLMMPVMMSQVWSDIALRIRSGDIATDLSRPLDPQRYYLAYDYGRATYQIVFRGLPPFVIGALAFHLRLPDDALTWLAFLVSVVLAVLTSYAFRFVYNCAAFWTIDIRGIGLLALLTATVCSGFLVPLAFFPEPLGDVVRLLPFAAMIQTPIDIFLQDVRGLDVLIALGSQLFWAVVLLVIGRLIFARGARRLVVQGG
jgi:ABC-2 type transport system permease protein